MLLRCRSWSMVVRAFAAVCAITVATLVVRSCLGRPTSWWQCSHHCQSLHFNALAASTYSTASGRMGQTASRPNALHLGFGRYEAVCANNVPNAAELDGTATSLALANDSRVDAATVAELTYRTCCTGGRLQRPCASAERPLRLPVTALQTALASGRWAIENLSSVDLASVLVFVTASSADHFEESLAVIRSVQHHFQSRARIVYWDMGLSETQAAVVAAACGVEYRRFEFTKYPPHVASLRTYAFKPLAIMETFAAGYVAIWWVDASIRFTSPCVEHVLALAKERHGLVLFREPVHSVWSTTYSQMYEYIVTNEESLKRTVTAPGTTFVVVNTRELFSAVLFWFYACALDERCIAPVAYPEPCRFAMNGYGDAAWLGGDHFAGCHRFDQSLLTILAANVWGFDNDGYRYEQSEFKIERWPDGKSGVERC